MKILAVVRQIHFAVVAAGDNHDLRRLSAADLGDRRDDRRAAADRVAVEIECDADIRVLFEHGSDRLCAAGVAAVPFRVVMDLAGVDDTDAGRSQLRRDGIPDRNRVFVRLGCAEAEIRVVTRRFDILIAVAIDGMISWFSILAKAHTIPTFPTAIFTLINVFSSFWHFISS